MGKALKPNTDKKRNVEEINKAEMEIYNQDKVMVAKALEALKNTTKKPTDANLEQAVEEIETITKNWEKRYNELLRVLDEKIKTSGADPETFTDLELNTEISLLTARIKELSNTPKATIISAEDAVEFKKYQKALLNREIADVANARKTKSLEQTTNALEQLKKEINALKEAQTQTANVETQINHVSVITKEQLAYAVEIKRMRAEFKESENKVKYLKEKNS